MNNVRCIRYGLPDGNIWVAVDNATGKRVAARSKDEAKEALSTRPEDDKAVVGKPTSFSCGVVYQKTDDYTNPPMLIIGTGNWARINLPFFFMQKYDVHFFFQPQPEAEWKVHMMCVFRTGSNEPLYITSTHKNIQKAMDNLVLKAVSLENVEDAETIENPVSDKYMMWLTNWIYRTPKISLKDILHLEDYK